MTGESQRDDNDDFLDDDFVIEDMAPKNEDLDRLFEVPEDKQQPKDPADPDAEDVLFAEPELGYDAEPKFTGGPQFAESAEMPWDGESLELEAEEDVPSEAAPAAAMAAAEASFAEELDTLLTGDEDFALDSEQELEVIGEGSTDSGDGISEFEQSGPFVLDDGEGLWQDDQEAEAVPDDAHAQPAAASLQAEVEPGFEEVELGVPHGGMGGDDQESAEPGWEPLPTTNVDGLSEVDGVERAAEDEYADEHDPVYGEQEQEFADEGAPALVGAGVAADAEGHDLYVHEDDGNEVVGARARSGRGFRVLMSLAASLTVLAAGAVVVLRPEWVGLRLQPDRVEQAQVSRPDVALDVPQPAAPVVAAVEPTPPEVAPTVPPAVEPTPPAVVVTEPPPVTPEPTPVAVEPPVTDPTPEQPVAVEPSPVPSVPVVTAPAPELPGWPTGQAVPDVQRTGDGLAAAQDRLVRVSDDLMIGDPDDLGRRARAEVGVAPGSRAFAQLQNGNFFIGNVKTADTQRITLRVDNGEVTIPTAAIARLTELGSADYEDLQKVTSGFVRLTNNNRLVGGILSGIADDHVVLEFRKNRVMLPKSLIGQVVQGENDAAIRLDTTREEDDWLRRLVERQLGSGTGAEPPSPPQGSQSPR